MTDLQFGEDQEFSRPAMMPQQQSLFVRLVLRTGIVTTEKEAEYVLIGIIVLCVVIMFFMLTSGGSSNSSALPFEEGQNIVLPAGGTTP